MPDTPAMAHPRTAACSNSCGSLLRPFRMAAVRASPPHSTRAVPFSIETGRGGARRPASCRTQRSRARRAAAGASRTRPRSCRRHRAGRDSRSPARQSHDPAGGDQRADQPKAHRARRLEHLAARSSGLTDERAPDDGAHIHRHQRELQGVHHSVRLLRRTEDGSSDQHDGHEVHRESWQPAQPGPAAPLAQPQRGRAKRHQTTSKRQRAACRHHESNGRHDRSDDGDASQAFQMSMPGDAKGEAGDHHQHRCAGRWRQETEVRRRLPEERQADDNRRKTVEEPAQRTRDASAISGTEPRDRIGESERNAAAPGSRPVSVSARRR